ncbi:hypothetical protein BDBG_01647 [Blastomyces gilchristii SLH14081]|uniref:Uncharacterized protein n=1 Tax=Blastomyces gilchristii (strain SLH14081) TaxID=559298 RepID=A0A179UB10_BLAGS|nr:uncharacterized protein BDBG_01647 [Blastomyces gilchristii SLH14081]OAT05215.1 hypothetical protein BDBG_01647 [Blastomyces gilchristii SLH14081]
MTVKKVRLKAETVSMSCESITLIVTSPSPPASLAAAVVVAVLCSEVSSLLLAVKNEFDESVIVNE